MFECEKGCFILSARVGGSVGTEPFFLGLASLFNSHVNFHKDEGPLPRVRVLNMEKKDSSNFWIKTC
jgi:hypothetical protein